MECASDGNFWSGVRALDARHHSASNSRGYDVHSTTGDTQPPSRSARRAVAEQHFQPVDTATCEGRRRNHSMESGLDPAVKQLRYTHRRAAPRSNGCASPRPDEPGPLSDRHVPSWPARSGFWYGRGGPSGNGRLGSICTASPRAWSALRASPSSALGFPFSNWATQNRLAPFLGMLRNVDDHQQGSDGGVRQHQCSVDESQHCSGVSVPEWARPFELSRMVGDAAWVRGSSSQAVP